jgi:dynein heavy chain 1
MVYNLNPHENFRLFLTMENNPKVPTTLLRSSHVLVFEPPSGIKAALVRSYAGAVSPQRTDRDPVERKRLHFIVSWFNAVVQERLRYTPIGWSKYYEFNESDQRCTLDCIDEWIDCMGTGRSNIDPEKIPWDALRTLISQSVFGGKIDNEFDNKILLSLVNQFFRPESYNDGFKLFESTVGGSDVCLSIPEEKNHAGFVQWIKGIELTETPAWSGLPNNVEKLVREKQAIALVADIKKIQGTGDDLVAEKGKESKDEGQSAWLTQL